MWKCENLENVGMIKSNDKLFSRRLVSTKSLELFHSSAPSL